MPGLANGLAVMRDQETNSLWDHITGECFEGPLQGEQLQFWGISLTTGAAELTNHPETVLLKSSYWSPISMFVKLVLHRTMNIGKNGTFLAPHFWRSMSGEVDPRLPHGAQGLGLIDTLRGGKFYPMDKIAKGGYIEDEWLGRPLRVARGAIDGVPFATWQDDGERPMQLLTRWYGFSFTYPGCQIYDDDPVNEANNQDVLFRNGL